MKKDHTTGAIQYEFNYFYARSNLKEKVTTKIDSRQSGNLEFE
jgi:hypothetical protein